MSEKYSFITQWRIKAPVEQVWNAIYESTEWPNWWKGVIDVKVIEENNSNGVNGVREYTWKSVLPYLLRFKMRLIERREPEHMLGIAFGELEGEGIWKFEQRGDISYIQYNWEVVTNKAWMNYFSFLLKPLFKYNHDVVMRWGAKGLAKKLDVELVSY
jgi:hypothetical protein